MRLMMKKVKVELLAPAGSFETMKAVINAGADAVYMGGPMFGARAYAENPDTDRYLEAIDYAHLRGVKLYMTVNTLLKEKELYDDLYEYMLPFYERGLDAAIVQDMGVLKFLKGCFPDLPLHISTQMTCTGAYSAEYFKGYGAERVVPARELNLEEIKKISDTGIEVECFVHGAICYCYSGKCLFSSLAGGRSGNRGRCAQPCRQSYVFYDENGSRLNNKKETYLLSLKDMNTLDILPEIIDAGVYSLKIEGRMKKAEYAAGVVAVYRKYLDKILSGEEYRVEAKDRERLFDLFNRNGFNEGYFKQKNGRDMMSLTETEFRSHDEQWQSQIRERYINSDNRLPVSFNAFFSAGTDMITTASYEDVYVSRSYPEPQPAANKPATKEQVAKQLVKSGGTDFDIRDLEIELEDGLFIPVSELNRMRRETLEELREEYLKGFFRTNSMRPGQPEAAGDSHILGKTARVQSKKQLQACLEAGSLSRIYLSASMLDASEWSELSAIIRGKNISPYLAVSEPFRLEDERFYERHIKELKSCFDGVLCDSVESLCYFNSQKVSIIADQGLYSWNSCAVEHLREMGIKTVTAPYELNLKELLQRGMGATELVVYGYLPMMVTAGCLWRSTVGCRREKGRNQQGCLKDSQNRSFIVCSDCKKCGNTIYNCVPMLLEETAISRLAPEFIRYQFTVESYEEVINILSGRISELKMLTRGHIKRGVE